MRDQADDEAHDDETDDVGDADAPRDDGDGGGDDQQQDERLLDPGRRPEREARTIAGAGARRPRCG